MTRRIDIGRRRRRPGAAAALALALGLAGAARAQPAAPVSPAQPAGAACPPGGKYVTDDFAPKPAFPEQTRAPRQDARSGFRIETLLTGVAFGRAMAPMPDGRLLLAERSGRLRIVGRGGGAGPAIAGGPPIADPGALIGLMDIALDPHFAVNRLVYLSYVTPKPAAQPAPAEGFGRPPDGIGHIAKARLSAAGDRLEGLAVLFDGARVRRLVAAGDGTLFFTTVAGDAKAQALDQDSGKVLRIRTDGTAPADNPHADRTDAGRFAYDLGHRDADGLALDARGRVWASEHGPRGGDELNLILKGRNYGFPLIGYGREYSGAEINGGLTQKEGLEQPVYYWTPDIAPSGLMIYSGSLFPQWKGDVFVGGLVAESLVRLTLKDDKVVGEAFMLAERCQRIRDVRQAPDGAIYVLTDGAEGQLLRLSPA